MDKDQGHWRYYIPIAVQMVISALTEPFEAMLKLELELPISFLINTCAGQAKEFIWIFVCCYELSVFKNLAFNIYQNSGHVHNLSFQQVFNYFKSCVGQIYVYKKLLENIYAMIAVNGLKTTLAWGHGTLQQHLILNWLTNQERDGYPYMFFNQILITGTMYIRPVSLGVVYHNLNPKRKPPCCTKLYPEWQPVIVHALVSYNFNIEREHYSHCTN